MLLRLGKGLDGHGAVTAQGGGRNTDPLDTAIASVLFDLDATLSDSYDGSSQTWANLIASPADGSAQTAYDFNLGAGSSAESKDPAFAGSAGDAGAYFSFDGNPQGFRLVGANTAFLNNMHKSTGAGDFWVAATLNIPNSTFSMNALFATYNGTTSKHGIYIGFDYQEKLTLMQADGAAPANSSGSTSVTAGTDVIVIVSRNASTDTARFWVASATAAEEVSSGFQTTTTNPTEKATIGGMGFSLGNQLQNGAKLYSFAMGNEYLDNTKAATIIAHLEARHERDYTP